MNVQLVHNTYGKHRVRVSKIKRDTGDPSKHELVEATIDVVLEGELEAAYLQGDNSSVVATDTCKNTIYVLAKEDPFDSIESFGVTVAEHFLKTYDHLTLATVTLVQKQWARLLECPHAFTGNDAELPTATVVARRGQATRVTAGLRDLVIAKTTQSGFANFHRDKYRTLPDTDDRIFATSVTASWEYDSVPQDPHAARRSVRSAMLSRFIDHYSRSVQETLMLMGKAALESCRDAASITLTMPNKHHILANLQPFDHSNDNEVFVVTDEPFGFIQATVAR
ncbi:MAG: factor-independent urate hydroxylase [Planctomycetota bacterium]